MYRAGRCRLHTYAALGILLVQHLLAADVPREQIQRLKDQLAVETGLSEQYVRFFARPSSSANGYCSIPRVVGLSGRGHRQLSRKAYNYSSHENSNASSRRRLELGVDQLSPADLIRPQHVAQITSLDVLCGADSMRIKVAFDRPFTGVIYSKDHFSTPSCHHVSGGSGSRTISFVIGASTCGTRFSRRSDGRHYMEHVIIVQNDVGLQKALDTARKIRCMLRASNPRVVNEKVVSYAFNVDRLDQKEVTFETDEEETSKANAILDIQMGQGPYAPSVDGLVKIGDILTMVVEAEGADDVDIRVRQCIAMNGDRTAHVNLTDDVGCTMKPNLLSPWLKTKQENGVMAYSYFSAFKFPEQMDVIIECSLDLCKGACGFCQEDSVTVSRALARSRRALNTTAEAAQRTSTRRPVRLARRLRVVAPQDIALTEATRTLLAGEAAAVERDTVCLSVLTFVVGLALVLLLLLVAAIATAVLCVRVRGQPTALVAALPDSSFHAFSTISGKP